MTHEGRMSRGEKNFKQNILLENEDTKYFIQHSKKKDLESFVEPEKEVKEEKPKKKTKEKINGR